ncbi:homeodomain-interacting protein kinase 2-like isoform X1 [Takifugu rubripes]|uniref:homeodomain-interacting protein kinase 2-like isoform X1 n=1 Tax=Takifugu rubripes TaxID=31033 RepID=UPI001145A89C|nr:homeodomain-interacting protein kinase 2-like isoform X1 [Takifugu rubripes]XP_029700616.1 homeodomain-interacting protein kinase 2-like isoform X1 [Takifugu rubripes]
MRQSLAYVDNLLPLYHASETPCVINIFRPSTLFFCHHLDHDKCNIIRIHGAFATQGIYCMVFEHLDRSLADLLEAQPFNRLHPNHIRLIVWQLAIALDALNSFGLTHTDINIDNIMLVNQKKYPFKVKLIDLGLASEMSSLRKNQLVQPLIYRAPEVMLGLPLTAAVDIWSLGCLAATLYLGRQQYGGFTEYEMTEGYKQTSPQPDKPLKMELYSLDDILIVFPVNDEEKLDLVLFVDLLIKMLHLEPGKRITPQQILKIRFLTSFLTPSLDLW